MSNTTSTKGQNSPTTPASSDTAASGPPANPTTSATLPDTTTTTTVPPTSTPAPPTTSSTPVVPPTTSSAPPPPATTSSTPGVPPTTSSPPPPVTTPGGSTSTIVTVVTSTQELSQSPGLSTSAPSTSSTAPPINPGGNSGSGGLNSSGKIAVGVVVPIAAVALLVLAGLFFWRKHKARKEADEERRKEVEDYAYNPNADPTVPAVGVVGDGPYEMKEDGSAGYRGWGSTTVAGSTGRKASTTISGGAMTGPAYSDATSPTRGNISDTRSGEPLMDGSQHGSYSPEGEILGAMGPSAAANRGGDVRRGPSNASSSYSAAARSDGSGEGGIGMAIGGPNPYYEQYGSQNPYGDQGYGQQRQELPGQPIIRDNPARRNTRIENPSHYPQQSAGISQNF